MLNFLSVFKALGQNVSKTIARSWTLEELFQLKHVQLNCQDHMHEMTTWSKRDYNALIWLFEIKT